MMNAGKDPNASNNADDMGIDILMLNENAIETILKEELTSTKNPNNPFDLNTSYGQYATIQAVLREYGRLSLQKLVNKPMEDPEKAAEVLHMEYDQ